jgi:hypothetical protein
LANSLVSKFNFKTNSEISAEVVQETRGNYRTPGPELIRSKATGTTR